MRRIDPKEARERGRRAAAVLATDPAVRLVFLFGSAAAGRAARDVDLAVALEPSTGREAFRELERRLSLATGSDFHLVDLHRAPVALAREIADTGICLFARDPQDEVELVTRARARYWDFRPYLEEQWAASRRRTEERLNGPAS
jgi:predicted nucleotidyltransferase